MTKKDRKLRNIVSLIVVLIMALVLTLVMGIHTAFATEYNIAYANTQMVEVDGKSVEFNMYALRTDKGDTNYVRLRDVAYVLDSSAKSFDVDYYPEINTIFLWKNVSYIHKNGTEMTTPFTGNRSYIGGVYTLFVDFEPVSLDAILLTDNNGGGYTYVKLRDLGKAIGFDVDWVAGRGIVINTGTKSTTAVPTTNTVTTTTVTTTATTNNKLTQADLNEMAKEVVFLINEERKKVGASPLGTYESLDKAATIRANEQPIMYSHTRPNGTLANTALNETGASRNIYAMGENIAWEYKTPSAKSVMELWMNSPGHKSNILERSFTHVGVACIADPNHPNEYYWVQMFVSVSGRPANETPASNYTN